jgi:hypothetical protein
MKNASKSGYSLKTHQRKQADQKLLEDTKKRLEKQLSEAVAETEPLATNWETDPTVYGMEPRVEIREDPTEFPPYLDTESSALTTGEKEFLKREADLEFDSPEELTAAEKEFLRKETDANVAALNKLQEENAEDFKNEAPMAGPAAGSVDEPYYSSPSDYLGGGKFEF